MKNFICFALIVCLFACKPDGSVGKPAGVATNEKGKSSVITPKKVDRDILSPLSGLWKAEVVVNIKDLEEKENYKSIWFDLNLDQTFKFGQFEEQLHTGTYDFDPATNIIDLYFNPTGQKVANQYKIQGIGTGDGSTVIWLGNTPKNPVGMQIKMVKNID